MDLQDNHNMHRLLNPKAELEIPAEHPSQDSGRTDWPDLDDLHEVHRSTYEVESQAGGSEVLTPLRLPVHQQDGRETKNMQIAL